MGQEYINNTEAEVLITSLQAINKNDIPRFGKLLDVSYTVMRKESLRSEKEILTLECWQARRF